MHHTRGFTLMELLVVIAIIGILGSIMYPVLARGKERAHQATCLSNLRQCGVALRMYMDDYETFIPPADGPARQILKKMPTCCPNDKEWTNGCTQEYGLPLIGSYVYTRSVPIWMSATQDELVDMYQSGNQPLLADIFHGSDGIPAPLHTEDTQVYINNNRHPPYWRQHVPDSLLYVWPDGHAAVSHFMAPQGDVGTVLKWSNVMQLPG